LNRPVLISVAAVLAIAIAAALLWPEPPDSGGHDVGFFELPIPVLTQEATATPGRDQSGSARGGAKEAEERRTPPVTDPRTQPDFLALQKRYAEAVANLPQSLEQRYTEQATALGSDQQIRTSVMRFQDVFGPDANPLSDEQTESVVAALVAEQARINRDMSSIPRRYGNDLPSILRDELDRTLRFSAENNRRLVMAASPYLNAGQLVDYREMLQQDMDKSVESLRTQIENPSVIPFTLEGSGALVYRSDGRILRPRP
jgi:hypothetical protein